MRNWQPQPLISFAAPVRDDVAIMPLSPPKPRAEHRVTLCEHTWKDWPAIAPRWAELFQESGASFFLHPVWLETWLETFGEELDARILAAESENEIIGACLIVRRIHWLRFLPLRRIYLNCSGEDEEDSTCIEYNRILCLPGYERQVADALRQYLAAKAWDELVLAGMESQEHIEPLCDGAFGVQVREKPCWYVDLGDLRHKGLSYESSLSSNTRAQIRRSIRLLEEKDGPLKILEASTTKDALEALTLLGTMHQRTWLARGKSGVFASKNFVSFHRRLISKAFDQGLVHVLLATAGDRPIGALYNFFYQGRIYFYQSGFEYGEDNRLRPGLVTHFLAISHYLKSRPEVCEYDFLAGDSQYKRSLGKNQRNLKWIVAQAPTFQSRLVTALRKWKNGHARLGK